MEELSSRTITVSESHTETVVTTMTSATHCSDPAVEGSGGMVKLLKLVPKKFNGDLNKWESFWSKSPENNINSSRQIQLPQLIVKGPAVAGLKLTFYYSEAIDTLKKRFGNEQQIISCYMNTI